MHRLEVGCTAERVTLVFKGRLSLYEVTHAHSGLLAVVPLVEKRDCYIDLRHIESVDMAAVQLLLVWERLVCSNGRSLILLAHESMASMLRSLGLGRLVALSPEAL